MVWGASELKIEKRYLKGWFRTHVNGEEPRSVSFKSFEEWDKYEIE